MRIDIKSRDDRCLWLMLALLGTILLIPIGERGLGGRILLGALSTFIALAGIYSVSRSKLALRIGVMLMVPTIVMRWVDVAKDWGAGHFLLNPGLYGFALSAFLTYMVAKYVLGKGPVTTDRLRGALCIYLLLGYLWTDLYMLLEGVMPGSFGFGGAVSPDAGSIYRELVYFSFVTLTTLGYGDTTPLSSYARSLAILESICGVLFIGVLVARMAGTLGQMGRDTGAGSEDA